ncbi:hypothetical protein I4U23_015762 [Adineta vaga]|nr:hypothetical protein I4U23_015762 [Adineta vaga]
MHLQRIAGSSLPTENSCLRSNPSFEAFIRYILIDSQTSARIAQMNYHWQPYSTLCQVCKFKYNFIGKYETFTKHVTHFLKLFNLSDWNIQARNGASGLTTWDYQKFYLTLPDDLICQLIDLYEDDFRLFNYRVEDYINRPTLMSNYSKQPSTQNGVNFVAIVQIKSIDNDDSQLITLVKCIQEESSHVNQWERLGRMLFKLSQFNKAEEFYKILLEQTSNEYETACYYNQLGYIKDNQGDYRTAISYYEQSVELWQKNVPISRQELANTYCNIELKYNKINNTKNEMMFSFILHDDDASFRLQFTWSQSSYFI